MEENRVVRAFCVMAYCWWEQNIYQRELWEEFERCPRCDGYTDALPARAVNA